MSSQKMIVGLGNPGPTYLHNRHNIGFQCVDLFAQRHNIDLGRMQQKARTGDGWVQKRSSPLDTLSGGIPQVQRVKVLLAKPLTYMNLSGDAVGPLARYYDIDPDDLIVVHDDLDLEPGQLRLRRNGGSGGQNGIKSIIANLGTQDFHRVRVGIGRPPGRMRAADYVLQNFTRDEEADIIGPTRERVLDALECWLFEGIDTAMNRYNG
ncbi:MAG: aminoacyl-tRNA hydrolase [Caldilineaceae bacterium]